MSLGASVPETLVAVIGPMGIMKGYADGYVEVGNKGSVLCPLSTPMRAKQADRV